MPDTYMPLIANASPIAAQGEANEAEQALYTLIATHKQQQRAVCVLDSVLCGVARQHAEDMSRRDFFSHTNPDGHGPNWRIRQAGYVLPDWYGKEPEANNCESIAAGQPTPAIALDGWLHSPSHIVHVLGQLPFYQEQTRVGVGYAFAQDSDFRHYWCMVSAPPEENP